MDTPGEPSDEELLARALHGAPDSFGFIFDRHGRRILAHARRQIVDQVGAEDIAATVFLDAWRLRSTIRVVDGSVLPWLLVTANNIIRNQNRSARRYAALLSRLPTATATPDHAITSVEALDAAADAARIRQAFASLKPRYQDVLTLCVLEELSVSQAAQTLGAPVSTVKTRLSRAKKQLAGLIPTPDSASPMTIEGALR